MGGMVHAMASVRRHLAFMGAVTRHTHALAVAFLGTLLLSAPPWVIPLLPDDWATKANQMSHQLAEPHTYFRLAVLWFLGSVFYACFLAWNEERDGLERVSRQLQRDTPELYLIVKQAEYSFLEGRLEALIEIHNLGAATALHGWCGGLAFQDGHESIVSERYFITDELPHFQELFSVAKRGVGNLLNFQGRIERRGKLEGWVGLTVGVHGDDRNNIKEFVFQVCDSENARCQSSSAYYQRRKSNSS